MDSSDVSQAIHLADQLSDGYPESSSLKSQVEEYTYMGSVGENYSLAMRLIPMTYRVWQSPATIYDSMIFVPTTTPTVILPSE